MGSFCGIFHNIDSTLSQLLAVFNLKVPGDVHEIS